MARARGGFAGAGLGALCGLAASVAALCGLAASAGAAGAPAGCRELPPGDDLPARLALATPGTRLCLAPGRHAGPLRVGAGVTLAGPREAVLAGGDTVVTLAGAGAALEGLTIEGSGRRFDRLDAAVFVTADDVRIERIAIRGALFGIRAERVRGLSILDNDIHGDPTRPFGLRGDGIRLWEVRGSTLTGNRLADGRDLVAWYAPHNRFQRNRVEGGRYGLHFMYSHDNLVRDNVFADDVVGIFVMYSRRVTLERNQLLRSGGAAGIGLGMKEAGDLRVRGNLFVANTTGVFVDTSAGDPAERNRFEGNEFRFHDRALLFHGAVEHNEFLGNLFRDNRVNVAVEGRGDARAALWRGNAWDDYVGYDLDGDGIGDLPYQPASLSNDWIAEIPALAFFRGTLALGAVEWIARALPLFEPTLLLIDAEPRLVGGGPFAD
jgi:nitrous oxidase accessory protein